MGVGVLGRPVLGVREAARQVRIPASTLANWLEGGTRHRAGFRRCCARRPAGGTGVTWGELVEARYLRAYRERSVSVQRLRALVMGLPREFGAPCPLAHFTPFVDTGRRLLLEIQEDVQLPESMRMVCESRTGQLILDRRVDEFLERVDFAATGMREAQRIHPAGRRSPVVVDPRIASAACNVRGTRTGVAGRAGRRRNAGRGDRGRLQPSDRSGQGGAGLRVGGRRLSDPCPLVRRRGHAGSGEDPGLLTQIRR